MTRPRERCMVEQGAVRRRLRGAGVAPLAALLTALAPGAGGVHAQEPERVLQIPRVSQPPRLDQFLDDKPHDSSGGTGTVHLDWGGAELGARVADFRQREPGDGTPVSLETTAYASYDDENLYVVFVCRDDPAKVRSSIARREEIDADDQVVVYLDTFRDRERAYFFATNARGVQLDGVVTEGQDDDLSWDAVWQSEGRLTERGFVVRLAIPFRSLRFPRAPGQTWGVALGRVIRRNSEESYWPHLTKRVKGFVPQFALLQGLSNISAGRNLQLNPYTTLARARFLDEDAAAFQNQGDERLGFDAKAVLRDALTLDATVHPDFSQVETDDPQVTLNERFDVFFPEKRPFFIENAGYFQTPVNLLFSRRIVDPGAGLRLTGKVGRWAVGAIAMNDREPGRVAAPDPLAGSRAGVGALRVQREFGEESTVGFLVTDRELEGSFNRAFSLDSRLRVGKTWGLAGQVIQSETRALNGARLSGSGMLAQLDRDGHHLDYKGAYLGFTPDFKAPLGFVKRVGFHQMEQEVQYKWRPDRRPIVAFGPTVSALFNWDRDRRLQDREIGAEFKVEFVGKTEIKLARTEAFELFEGLGFRPYDTKATVKSEWFKWLAVDASYQWGTAVNHDPATGLQPFLGRAAEAAVSLTVRPASQVRLDQVFIHSRLNARPSGARVFTERLWRSKINYQFNRFLSLRAIVDYEAETGDPTLADIEDDKAWRADVLLTYLLNPGTALYVGYTDNYQNLALVGSPPSVERSPRPDISTARQVFVKLSYLLRF
jgi:uncharacterized protein DUF5916